jgi:Ca2+-transporting ATPase
MRSQRHSIFTLKTQNLLLWGAMGLTLVLTTAVIYVPFLADLFEFSHISLQEYGVSVGIAFLIIPLVELVKFVQRLIAKKA